MTPIVAVTPKEQAQADALLEDLQYVINRHSRENVSGTPDHILAGVMFMALQNFEHLVLARDQWYGFVPTIGGLAAAKDGQS